MHHNDDTFIGIPPKRRTTRAVTYTITRAAYDFLAAYYTTRATMPTQRGYNAPVLPRYRGFIGITRHDAMRAYLLHGRAARIAAVAMRHIESADQPDYADAMRLHDLS